MSFDPTQQVRPPQGYPSPQGYLPGYAAPQPPAPDPYALSGGPPFAPAGAMPGSESFFKKLGPVGLTTCIGGALLIISFAFPWSMVPSTQDVAGNISDETLNGFNTAGGFHEFSNPVSVSLFPTLWLVVLGAVALIVLAVLMSLGRIPARLGALSIVEVSALSLVLELLYLLEVNSLDKEAHFGGLDASRTFYSVAIGFWLALVVTAVILGVGVFGLVQGRMAAAPVPVAVPYQQVPQPPFLYPAAQPYQPPAAPPYQSPTYPGQPPQYPPR